MNRTISRAHDELHLFLIALTFFTRLPSPLTLEFSETKLNRAARYFPMIGLVVGGFGAALVSVSLLVLPPPVASIIAIAGMVWITGAFHEDGFADLCDGFGGGWTKEQILTIMKDSRVGAFGALGVTLLTLLRVSTVGALPPHLIPPTLFATQAASRFFSVSFIFTDEYVRDDATTRAKPLATSLSVAEFVFSAICGLLPLLLLPTAVFAPLAAGVIVTRAYLGNLFNRKIGGYTGDCLGAAQQISEVVMLLAILSATWRSI